MSLTINADDFGMSPEVNEAIVLAFREGLINRTTLMVNMPYAKDAMELARKNGFIDRIGIHINLTAGKPLTDMIASSRVMCDKDGMFTAEFARNIKTRFFLKSYERRAVCAELKAQLDMYELLGGNLWHVDSHHHVHTDPSVWICLKKVLKDYPVKSVRLGRNMYFGGNPLMKLYKKLYNYSVNRFNAPKKDYFGSADDFKEYTSASGVKAELLSQKDVEIMVHPMFDENHELVDSMQKWRAPKL